MKRSFVNVGLLGALSLSLLNSLAVAETRPEHKNPGTRASKPARRLKVSTTQTEALPKKYQEIIDVLGEKEGSKPLVRFCGTGYIEDTDSALQLKGAFETIKEYRAQLESCSDDASNTLKKFLDDSLEKITITSKSADGDSLKEVSGKAKYLEGLDSSLRFHEGIKDFLVKKEKELAKFTDKFAEADKELKEALESLFKSCNAKEFKPSEDAKTTFQIDQFNQKIKATTLKEENACEISSDVAAAPSTEENESTTSEAPEREVAPPQGEGDSEEETGTEEAGTDSSSNGNGGIPNNVLDLPGVSSAGLGGAVGGGFFPGQGINQGVDPALAFNGLARDEDLLNRLLADFTRPNQSRVGGSPDNGRSFQAPPISISPQPGNQSQQQPQQNPYPQQPMPPFNPAAMMQPPAPIILPPEAYGARRDEAANRINPNQAAQTTAMMEMAKMQQQLLQAQMANQMALANQGAGVMNGNRMRRSRAAFRGTRANTSSRMINRGTRRISSTARALR